ncbi:hypothetical protein ARAM_006104 [Aspergillus rambellii]|uniref:Mitotic checkpoint regulator, MAD2B-interacting-domain-containing protein n=1 Tax=Aspergillus rambellii TaxID=308745 RepID=A0A0F8TY04_9EURO|nr:hypothetical protein ARAM_006104 [Aspergillus rambellii]
MALVSYSDSEASDSERENDSPAPTSATASKPAPSSSSSSANFHSIVDKSNPRKIRVALPELKPENPDGEDGPTRKKPRVGGGGAFSGFNSFLPAPKRTNATADKEKKAPGSARKVFSLKTGIAPGFDREADAEMRRDMAFGAGRAGGGDDDDDDDETIPKAGALRGEEEASDAAQQNDRQGVGKKKPEEVVLKGNPMMFKPLSVGRTQPKKRKVIAATLAGASTASKESTQVATTTSQSGAPPPPPPAPAPKPKVSLFSLSTEDSASGSTTQAQGGAYEPLVYTRNEDAAAAGPMPESDTASSASNQAAAPQAQTLDYIADDLNLSRSQRRQLFGRNADPSKSRILHFNTDQEYAANQALAHETDLAAAQHNPVRAIAPGKHTLQQLVNAASTQREALEESFASGKRNKKEAGAKYGW